MIQLMKATRSAKFSHHTFLKKKKNAYNCPCTPNLICAATGNVFFLGQYSHVLISWYLSRILTREKTKFNRPKNVSLEGKETTEEVEREPTRNKDMSDSCGYTCGIMRSFLIQFKRYTI